MCGEGGRYIGILKHSKINISTYYAYVKLSINLVLKLGQFIGSQVNIKLEIQNWEV